MGFVFLYPWVLGALVVLPAIYFLLRVMPPLPLRVMLPTVRFLYDLQEDHNMPSHMPWWLLLLRLMMAALVILALAGPIYKPAANLSGSGPLRIVMDNSWASAQNWDLQLRAAKDVVTRAGREKREIYLLPTAPSLGGDIVHSHAMSASQAIALLDSMTPMPWAASYSMAAEAIKQSVKMDSIWFGHGLNEGQMERLAKGLLRQGIVTYFRPDPIDLPVALRWPDQRTRELQVEILRPSSVPDGRLVTLHLLAEKGRILDQQSVRLSQDQTLVRFALPEALQNDATQVRIAGHRAAGSVLILDEHSRRRHVGIIAPRENTEAKPFVEASYYLKRALAPFSSLTFGTVSNILEQKPSLIVLPDIGAMPPESLDRLDQWVKNGGVLVRFAGPNMVKEADNLHLIPVDIRRGGRAMDGTMNWDEPLSLAPFEPSSPFYGLKLHDDILVKQQILANPSPDLEAKSWARLTDGTPLITADSSGDGLLVLIHTSATPAWSDLSISGVYVDILRRLVSLSGQHRSVVNHLAKGVLNPIWVLDGYGQVQKPHGGIHPINSLDFDNVSATSLHPPGLYAQAGYQKALNLGDSLSSLLAAGSVSQGVFVQSYDGDYEHNLMPYFLLLAIGLFLLDWIIMIMISSGVGVMRRGLTIIVLSALFLPGVGSAQASEIQYANALHMAYIQTGDAQVDSLSKRGLAHLGQALKNRTSAEPAGVVALNLERDDLVFFPVIYWPISEKQAPLSAQALEKLQNYLDHGGTILIDKRQRASQRRQKEKAAKLQSLIGSLNIPPLQPVPNDHVLGKSFYLLDHYPGLSSGDTLWVETRSAQGRDGVSSVIIGSHDWAGAWAMAENGRTTSRQYELALRFGVNVMMYALTGNYKADQVHLPAILERLGQ